MRLKFDKILGRIRDRDTGITSTSVYMGGVIPDSDYEVGDITQLGISHEIALFLECVVAGNTGPDVPDISTYIGSYVVTIGTATFRRKYRTSCSVAYMLHPEMKWYKAGDIPETRTIGAFDLSINYSSYNYYHLQVELTLLISEGDNKILIEYKSCTEGMIYPEVALMAGEGGIVEIWVRNRNTATYALSLTSMNYDDYFNINLYSVFDGFDVLPEGTVLAQVDTDTVEEPSIVLQSHLENTSNPHAVTKTQVELDNVDDTSDEDKPVSTAQATAIGLKFTLPALTSGSVLFSNGATIIQDNVNFFWDNVLKILKVLKLTVNGIINITGGEATLLGLKALQLPTGTAGIDAGLSVRTVANESIIQLGNNFSDYYSGAIDQSRAGSMLRLDTRNATPIPGGHAYSAIQLQTRGAGVVYTGYHVPFQISGQSPEGAFCMMDNGVVYFYYGINVQGKTVTGISAPTTIAANYTILAADDIIICNSATPITVSIPTGTASNKRLIIKNRGAGTVTLSGGATDVIDGVSTYNLYQYDSATILDYAANNWLIL